MLGLLFSLFNKFISKYLKNFSDSISNMARIKTNNPLSQKLFGILKKSEKRHETKKFEKY